MSVSYMKVVYINHRLGFKITNNLLDDPRVITLAVPFVGNCNDKQYRH